MSNNKAKTMGMTNAVRRWKDGEVSASGTDGGKGTIRTPKIFCKQCNAYEEYEVVATIHTNRDGKKMASFTCKRCDNKWYGVDRTAPIRNSTIGDLIVGNVGITLKVKGKTPDFAKEVLKDMGLYSPIHKVSTPDFDGNTIHKGLCKCGHEFSMFYDMGANFRCPECYGTKFDFIEAMA